MLVSYSEIRQYSRLSGTAAPALGAGGRQFKSDQPDKRMDPRELRGPFSFYQSRVITNSATTLPRP
jgi:hypothetical protein